MVVEATLGSFDYTPEAVSFIQSQIKEHLDCDDVLAEYIVVMVRNNKTKKDVTQDLSDFIPNDANKFVDWLWNFVVSYMEMKKEPSTSSTPGSSMGIDSPSLTSPSTTRNDLPKRPTSKLVLNAARAAAEDSKTHPSLLFSLDDKIAESSKYSKKRGIREKRNGNNNHNNNNNRSNQHNKHSHSDKNFKVTFSTTGDSSRKRKINNHAGNDDEDIQNEDTEDNVKVEEEEEDDEEYQESIRSTKKSDKKERCSFWPMCKNQDTCAYFHPTTQCNLFPKCPYGDKCLYIHPSILCKFGAACTRPDCSFNHPQRPMMYEIPSPPPCRNGFACPNKKFCSFAHPPIACKYGEACTNGRRCIFGHGKPCMYGAACKTAGCTFAHHVDATTPPTNIPIDCRYGKECTNPSCIYQHPDRQQAMDESTDQISSTLPSTPPQQTTENISESNVGAMASDAVVTATN